MSEFWIFFCRISLAIVWKVSSGAFSVDETQLYYLSFLIAKAHQDEEVWVAYEDAH